MWLFFHKQCVIFTYDQQKYLDWLFQIKLLQVLFLWVPVNTKQFKWKLNSNIGSPERLCVCHFLIVKTIYVRFCMHQHFNIIVTIWSKRNSGFVFP